MKELVARFRETSPLIEGNIFKSVHNVNLGKVVGYTKDGVNHLFLENYKEN
jgi:hypothetical protein